MYEWFSFFMNECTRCEKYFMRNENIFKEKSHLVIFSKEVNALCKVCRWMWNAWMKTYVNILLQCEVMFTKYLTHFIFYVCPSPSQEQSE